MEKEFVTYTQSLELKKLGFDKKCLGWMADWSKKIHLGKHEPSHHHQSSCNAILKQQVFKWFREKHDWSGEIGICCTENKGFLWDIASILVRTEIESSNIEYDTYEEAESECIDKLIEMLTRYKQYEISI